MHAPFILVRTVVDRRIAMLLRLIALLLAVQLPCSLAYSPGGATLGRATATHTPQRACVAALAKKAKSPKKGRQPGSVDFARAASTDADGYRRGSFGIGEKESVVIWLLVAAALVFGGGLDEETAQKIGEAQRGFYPKPPGF